MYKIKIWEYYNLADTFENNDISKVLEYYNKHWKSRYKNDMCVFDIFKDNKELSFEEKNELGFF